MRLCKRVASSPLLQAGTPATAAGVSDVVGTGEVDGACGREQDAVQQRVGAAVGKSGRFPGSAGRLPGRGELLAECGVRVDHVRSIG